jgi:hypothetical protein
MPPKRQAIPRNPDGTINCTHCGHAVSEGTWRTHQRKARLQSQGLGGHAAHSDNMEDEDIEDPFPIHQPRYKRMFMLIIHDQELIIDAHLGPRLRRINSSYASVPMDQGSTMDMDGNMQGGDPGVSDYPLILDMLFDHLNRCQHGPAYST